MARGLPCGFFGQSQPEDKADDLAFIAAELKTYRVTVVERLVHAIVIEAPDADVATQTARDLWLQGEDDDRFELDDADLQAVVAVLAGSS